MTTTRTSGQRRYLTTNSTQADFTTTTPVLSNGRRGDLTSVSTLGGALFVAYAADVSSTGTPFWKVQELGPYRGARIQMFGTGVNSNDTVPNWRLWVVRGAVTRAARLPDPNTADIVAAELTGHSFGTCTISTAAGSANDIVSASEFFADSITQTLCTSATSPAGKASAYETAYGLGTSAVYAPTDNSPAELIIPDFGGGALGFILEFDLVANVTGMNALVELTK